MNELNTALKQRLESYLLRTGQHHYAVAEAAGVPRRVVSSLLLGGQDGEPSIAQGAAINSVIEAP